MRHRFYQGAQRGRLGALASCIGVVVGVSLNAWPSLTSHAIRWARPRAAGAWPAPVGANPIAITVDEHTQRVFVLTRGPLGKGPLPEPTGPGGVSVLDAATGRLVRTTQVGIDPVQMVLGVAARRLYVVNQGRLGDELYPVGPGSVSILDAATGVSIRTTQVGTGVMALTVDERRGRAFTLTSDLGATNGHSSGTTSVLDARTGALLRTLPGVSGTALAVSALTGRLFVASDLSCPPTVSDTNPVNPGCLEVFNAMTGRRLATLPLSQTVGLRAMAVDDVAGRVVAMLEGMRGGVVNEQYASHAAVFDAATGTLLHSAKTSRDRSADAFALSVTAGRAVMINGPDGYDIQMNNSGSADISVVQTRDGQVLRTVGGTVGLYGLTADAVIDAQIGHIVVLTQPLSNAQGALAGPATLTILDVRTGRLLRTRQGQMGDVALGLDAQHGCLFVANARSNTVRMLDVTRL